jgi:hypothetical protein
LPNGGAQLAAQLAGVGAVLLLSVLSGWAPFFLLSARRRHRDRQGQVTGADRQEPEAGSPLEPHGALE